MCVAQTTAAHTNWVSIIMNSDTQSAVGASLSFIVMISILYNIMSQINWCIKFLLMWQGNPRVCLCVAIYTTYLPIRNKHFSDHCGIPCWHITSPLINILFPVVAMVLSRKDGINYVWFHKIMITGKGFTVQTSILIVKAASEHYVLLWHAKGLNGMDHNYFCVNIHAV